MKYWFDKSATNNNIVILSAKALVVASADEASQEQVEEQLNTNTHPKIVFGANGFRIIPFAAIIDLNSISNIDAGLEICYKSNPKTQPVTLKVSFDDAKSKLECMGYIKKLMLKNAAENEARDTTKEANKVASKVTSNDSKQFERDVAKSPPASKFTVKSSEEPGSKSRLDLNFKAMLNPALSLILALVATYMLYPKIHYIASAVGGICVLASLYFLYRGFKKPSEEDNIKNDNNDAQESSLSKLSDKVFGIVKPVYLLGLAALAVTALYLLIPSELRGPASLYQAIQIHQASGTTGKPIQSFLDNGADINYMAEDGTTPLITALNFNEEKLAIELINKGATLNTQYMGQTPLDLAIEATLDKAVNKMLNKEMVTSNPQDLLMRSISSGLDFENIQLIADSGMDMNHTDEEGITALGLALLFGSEPKVVKLLLDRGASTKIKVGEVSPLEFAKLRGYKEISAMLEQHSS